LVNAFYWERHPDGPFATLIAVAATYCDAEQSGGAYEDLKRLAQREDDEEMRVFKSQLRQALADPTLLPDDELFDAVEYSDGSDEEFLRHLWRDLYGDESIPLLLIRGMSLFLPLRPASLRRDV
jgi:hypothetical protein